MQSVKTRTAAGLMRLLPREHLTRALGRVTDVRVPQAILQPVLRLYSNAYSVDLDEAERPLRSFESFNEFFTRKLRDGARPLDEDPKAVLSPADGRLDDVGEITEGRTFLVKGQRYDAGTLLDSEEEGARFAGGRFAVVYLSPRDYHRVHAPVAGRVGRVRHVPGTLFPVNEFGVRTVPGLFSRNERVAVTLEDTILGPVAVVLVGAMVVGKITLAFDGPERPPISGAPTERRFGADGPRVERGGEVGAFQLGSTVVLLLPPVPGGYADGAVSAGSAVRMGQAIARRSDG